MDNQGRQSIEPTMNTYPPDMPVGYGDSNQEDTHIEPPPPPPEYNPYEPPPRKKPLGRYLLIALVVIICLASLAYGSRAYYNTRQPQEHMTATSTTHIAMTATIIKRKTGTPTPIVTPTPTLTALPTQASYTGPTAYGLYEIFTQDPSVTLLPASQGGGLFTIPERDWLQCCPFYPGHGGYSLQDEYASGYTTTFCIAVFNTANDAELIANQIANGGKFPTYCNYGYSPPLTAIQIGQCVLIYIPSLTYSNINGYISDMNNYCG